MPYEMMYNLLPELAVKETRTITVLGDNNLYLPNGEYGLLEMYCNDEDCDCRRVIINVVFRDTDKSLALICYGWEQLSFYVKWYYGAETKLSDLESGEKSDLRTYKGPGLSMEGPQSNLAPSILQLVIDQVLSDKDYVSRLKRHYKLFREKVDERHKENIRNDEKS